MKERNSIIGKINNRYCSKHKADNVFVTVKPSVILQDQRDNQTQPVKEQSIEEKDWQSELKILDDYNLYQVKFLNTLS